MYLLVVWHSKCTLVLLISAIGGFSSPLWRLWATEWIEATLLTELQVTPLSVDIVICTLSKSISHWKRLKSSVTLPTYTFSCILLSDFFSKHEAMQFKAGSSSISHVPQHDFLPQLEKLCAKWLRLISTMELRGHTLAIQLLLPLTLLLLQGCNLGVSVEVLEAFKFGNQWCPGNHLCSGGTIENIWKSLHMSGCWSCWPLWDIQPWFWNTARTLSVLSSAACSRRYSAARSRSRSPRRWYTVASCGSCAKQEALPLVGCCCSLLGVARLCYLHPVLVLLVWWVI